MLQSGATREVAAGAEPDSAAEGVDTVVGEATEIARTGSSTKTQSKSQDPKVQSEMQLSYAWVVDVQRAWPGPFCCRACLLQIIGLADLSNVLVVGDAGFAVAGARYSTQQK